MVFEFISVGGGGGYTKTALMDFGKILLFGTTFGFTFAHALAYAINKNFIPHYLLNVVSLSTVLLVFVESEVFAHESGLLAVVVMGMVMGNIKLQNIKELLYFKESLSVLLISILFILLSANVNIEDLMLLDTWNSLWLFLCVVFLVRPVAVFLSTANSKLKFNEKLFISWVGPRGIVAAGIASLFGSKLMRQGVEGGGIYHTFGLYDSFGNCFIKRYNSQIFLESCRCFSHQKRWYFNGWRIEILKVNCTISNYSRPTRRAYR